MQSPVDGAPDRSMVTTANVAPSGTADVPPGRSGSLAMRRTNPAATSARAPMHSLRGTRPAAAPRSVGERPCGDSSTTQMVVRAATATAIPIRFRTHSLFMPAGPISYGFTVTTSSRSSGRLSRSITTRLLSHSSPLDHTRSCSGVLIDG